MHISLSRTRRREKIFGPARGTPLDRNAKVRIMVYARAWSAQHRQGRQHRGPNTRAFMEVLEAMLWGFHNSKSGLCLPSYEAIAARARCCCRATIAEAIKTLEDARVVTWVNRIVREAVRQRDLFGHWVTTWRVVRASNAYVFRDPLPCAEGRETAKSENSRGTLTQEFLRNETVANDGLGGTGIGILTALQRLGLAIAAKEATVMP